MSPIQIHCGSSRRQIAQFVCMVMCEDATIVTTPMYIFQVRSCLCVDTACVHIIYIGCVLSFIAVMQLIDDTIETRVKDAADADAA